jgi:hypothetical protein
MAEGGPVTYGKGATAADLLAAEEAYLANPSAWTPETAYAAILESGISVQDAIDAGVNQDTINAIFTTPTALVGDQLSSQGQTSIFAGSGTPFANALTQANVDAYKAGIMADGEIDAAERLEMQKIATAEGVTYQDMIDFGVDPNILYNIPAATPTTKVCPIGTRLAGQTIGINEDCGVIAATTKVCPIGTLLEGQTIGINEDCGVKTAAATTKVCPIGTLKAGQTIGINDDCGILPALLPGLTDAEKAAQLATSQAAFTNTQDEYVTPTVYQPLPDNTGVYAAGEESLDRTFRDSAPRTEVLDSYGNLVNFDYTPAASLRSATGSGYNWTPPTVTGRPRSLMGADLLARYTGGRSAADLRQLTTGLGNGRTYSDYTGVLQNPGAYGGGLSKSQLYSRMRGLDYQRDKAAAADRQASGARGGISDYLAANPDIAASYAGSKVVN